MQLDQEIDFIEMSGDHGNLGIILLQRTSALNALNDSMVRAMHQQLTSWTSSASIKAVIIRAVSGRAFCAGGDIRSIYNKKITNDPTLGDFFWDEYRVNRQIFHFQKPYIALLDGITMGGGAGISIHGSHRVATENLSFSMPETGIGYFPDIGASYFLSRLQHKLGYYLGLTGERIAYQDCLALGLVDTVIASDTQEQLIKKLAESALPDTSAVTNIIKSFSVTTPESPLWAHRKEIEICFSEKTVEDIVHALQTHGGEWCLKTADVILSKSPSSLKIALRALQEGSHLDFDACMQMEERLAKHFMHSHDFFEGIRAAVIDKDRMPRWEPTTLGLVTSEFVDSYFK
jgi:enoyl-CoA hydratase/carnithine racemase